MNKWTGREIEWHRDSLLIRDLYNTTWKRHPITKKKYFEWQLLENYKGSAIGFCAEPESRKDILAGIYLVLPATVLVDNQSLNFSTSLYTMTHPSYYKTGIFKSLAKQTYNKSFGMGILGTVGVPNNDSLPGFSRALGFEVLGQFDLMGRIASPFHFHRQKVNMYKIISEKNLKSVEFALGYRKAESGVILFERSADFIRWRFMRCPGVSYQILITLGSNNSVTGLMVLRNAKKRGLPITVIVDFIVDHTLKDSELICETLLSYANFYAWKTFSPFIVTLVNYFSYEAGVLSKSGFRKIPKKILPHESNFILKFHDNLPVELKNRMKKFENWYFSFADYDIF